jgi:hypothetical protein
MVNAEVPKHFSVPFSVEKEGGSKTPPVELGSLSLKVSRWCSEQSSRKISRFCSNPSDLLPSPSIRREIGHHHF